MKNKNFLSKLYETRLGKYLIYGVMYTLFWKIASFEFAVIIALSQIVGEHHYQSKD